MKKRRVVDTNILIRLLTKDDPEQYQKVYALFQDEDILLIETVLLETELVLRYSYKFEKHQIIQAFRQLLSLSNVFVENPQLLNNALVQEGESFRTTQKSKKSDFFKKSDFSVVWIFPPSCTRLGRTRFRFSRRFTPRQKSNRIYFFDI